MPIAAAIPLAISGISALAGLFGNRKQKQEQQTSSSIDQTTTGSSNQLVNLLNAPEYTPEMAAVRDQILNMLMGRVSSSTDLTGYTTTGLQDINRGSDLKRRTMENVLASRGLSYSPSTAHSVGRVESDRIGEQISFLNQIPLLQRQLQGEDLSALGDFFSRLPVAQRQSGVTNLNTTSTTKGTSTGSSTTTQPGNMMGGLFSGLGSGIASTYGYQWGLDEAAKRGLGTRTGG